MMNMTGWSVGELRQSIFWDGWKSMMMIMTHGSVGGNLYIRGNCTDFNIQHSSSTVRQLSKVIGFSSFWLLLGALEVGLPKRARGLHLLPPGLDSFVCFGLPQAPFCAVGYLLLSHGTPLEPPLI